MEKGCIYKGLGNLKGERSIILEGEFTSSRAFSQEGLREFNFSFVSVQEAICSLYIVP
jgi:hypothetical protein